MSSTKLEPLTSPSAPASYFLLSMTGIKIIEVRLRHSEVAYKLPAQNGISEKKLCRIIAMERLKLTYILMPGSGRGYIRSPRGNYNIEDIRLFEHTSSVRINFSTLAMAALVFSTFQAAYLTEGT